VAAWSPFEQSVRLTGEGGIINPFIKWIKQNKEKQNKLRGFSPQANYTDRATAACR
jgi:hypothetical protein